MRVGEATVARYGFRPRARPAGRAQVCGAAGRPSAVSWNAAAGAVRYGIVVSPASAPSGSFGQARAARSG